MTKATALNNECLLKMAELWPLRIRCWRNNVGIGMFKVRDAPARLVRFGLPGEPDLDGVISPEGRRLAIETKVKDKVSSDQIAFGRMVKSKGGIYVIVRSVSQLVDKLMPIMGTIDADLPAETRELLRLMENAAAIDILKESK